MRIAPTWRAPARARPRLPSQCSRQPSHFRQLSSLGHFEKGDHVIYSRKAPGEGTLIHLHPRKRVNTFSGTFYHKDIIGRRPGEVVRTKTGQPFALYEPTLEQYVRMTARSNTPIYGHDANHIASLLELHPTPAHESAPAAPPLEILEAGTGHGSLTLHLAKAIHAANPPLPPSLISQTSSAPDPDTPSEDDAAAADELTSSSLTAWKATRRAVIHTVESNISRAKHARGIVRRFRHALYYHDVDFHVGRVAQHLGPADTARYAHIVLDLPSPESHFAGAARCLRPGGLLLVWVPSITQVVDALHEAKRGELPLRLVDTIEMGVGLSTGRNWDVRYARLKDELRREKEAVAASAGLAETEKAEAEAGGVDDGAVGAESDAEDVVAKAEEGDSALAPDPEEKEQAPTENIKVVCRPRVGVSIIGGGFVGMFRRVADRDISRR